MIQGGDPTGTGRGGESVYGCVGGGVYLHAWLWMALTVGVSPSGKFADEISKELKHTGAGVVSMVRTKHCRST